MALAIPKIPTPSKIVTLLPLPSIAIQPTDSVMGKGIPSVSAPSLVNRVNKTNTKPADFNKILLDNPSEVVNSYNTSKAIVERNWYIALPYGFRFNTRDGYSHSIFLPLSPSNISISTPFATNVITTMYGVVEEHSEQRFFDITIEGTTGMVSRYSGLNLGNKILVEKRNTFKVNTPIKTDAALGFFSNTLGIANTVYERGMDIFGQQTQESGLNDAMYTGYASFHRLYKFFLAYKKDVMRDTGQNIVKSIKHPLEFLNYKDNNKYDCVIRRFVLRRTEQDPMLYHYAITLRAFNLTSLEDRSIEPRNLAVELGLDSVKRSTLLSDMKSISNAGKDVFGALMGGVNTFGR